MMVTLRTVTDDDVFRLYRWQAAPETRRFFHRPSPPTWDEHVAYCCEHMGDLFWFVAETADGTPVGMVRIMPGEGGEPRWVSIVVAPEHRGKGFGARILTAARGARPIHAAPLLAEVHRDNAASRRAFEKAGWSLDGKREGTAWLTYRAPGGPATAGAPTSAPAD